MKIVIDISSIPYGTGVSRYTSNLARALIKNHRDHQYTLFAASLRQQKALKQFTSKFPKTKSTLLPIPPILSHTLFNSLNLPINPFTQADIFHAWDWYLPKSTKSKVVITIHDLAIFKYPQTAHPQIKSHHLKVMLRAHKFNTPIIAVSQSTKKDIIDIFHISEKNITVIPEALPQESTINLSLRQVDQIISSYNFTKPYFLIVGTQEPRKNIPRIISAWRKFKKNYHLVVAGKPGWEKITPEPGLFILGQVSSRKLSALYQRASLLLYTSIYEGFGLPILEAFHYKTPVLTSDVSSMPEVAGDAAVMVNPFQVKDIAQGIEATLQQSSSLKKKGTVRLNKFTWKKTADQTIKFYQSIL